MEYKYQNTQAFSFQSNQVIAVPHFEIGFHKKLGRAIYCPHRKVYTFILSYRESQIKQQILIACKRLMAKSNFFDWPYINATALLLPYTRLYKKELEKSLKNQ